MVTHILQSTVLDGHRWWNVSLACGNSFGKHRLYTCGCCAIYILYYLVADNYLVSLQNIRMSPLCPQVSLPIHVSILISVLKHAVVAIVASRSHEVVEERGSHERVCVVKRRKERV